MQRLFYTSCILAGLLVLNSYDTPLGKYEPKNNEEKSVLELLNAYLYARNNGDMETLASLFHEQGQYFSFSGIFYLIQNLSCD
jgi:hypothetical protein